MTLKIGIIGTGYFSKFHAAILSEMAGVKIAAICGTSSEKASAMASNFTDAKGYYNLVDMLDAEHLDAVYICVPPMGHGEIELALIKRGIPFLVEKPLGNELEIPTTVLEGIKEKSLLTSVGYHYRYSESVSSLKREVAGQNIGIALGQWMGEMPTVPWWREQSHSGGQFLEQTTHIVDLLRYVCGEIDEVQAVFAGNILSQKDKSVTVADVGTVTMKLQSGIVANISNTCILPNGIGKTGISLYTDQGMFDWSPGRLEATTTNGEFEIIDSISPYRTESEAFIHAVRTGDRSGILSDYEDSFKTHQVTCAALESAIKNTSIKLSS